MTAVVLLPGMDGSGLLFSDFSLALGARTIVVSYPPDRPFGYRELQEFVYDCLPIEEPFVLIAESFSGPLAILLATSGLPALKAVVLVCTFARLPGPRLPQFLRSLVTSLPVWRAPVRVAARVLLGRYDSPTWRTRLSAAMHGVASKAWKARLEAVIEVDVTSEITRTEVPILYLRAANDRVVFRSASELISRCNSRVKVVEMEGPHFLLQARPVEAAAAVRAFAHESSIAL